MNRRAHSLCLALLLPLTLASSAAGYASDATPESRSTQTPSTRSGELAELGRFQHAMRALPQDMRSWEAYTARTGETMEGAAGELYARVLHAVAVRGDQEWGAILDDETIPHAYKTEMMYEIMNARVGHNTAWSVGGGVVLPRAGAVNDPGRMKSLLSSMHREL